MVLRTLDADLTHAPAGKAVAGPKDFSSQGERSVMSSIHSLGSNNRTLCRNMHSPASLPTPSNPNPPPPKKKSHSPSRSLLSTFHLEHEVEPPVNRIRLKHRTTESNTMTTMRPRPPYTVEEIRKLYPPGLRLQLVQVVRVFMFCHKGLLFIHDHWLRSDQ